ncbi:disease resistance protein RPS6 isoform X1 [Arabidopsis lyrata subsp. lyrata]|uniref:disease resistance protein RPS6 isoform X1 n=1 Tax=Arabidopsis lyrata subsp. lyrata TaxID=81972 RepID=UPI000A29AEE3|nr:disease resistance protein RPS6 isoform X1 [Arabidopsis lyrata subsp. lyrata]|eukprot:XP_020886914.1 disease resistance protein RPS6 isoform X1 [Arabidopsis lyrata subsp. lyrata]
MVLTCVVVIKSSSSSKEETSVKLPQQYPRNNDAIARSYDVFPSFSGEDVRKTFLSHFLKELDRRLILAFKDNEIERSRSLDPELNHAFKGSKIAVVVFSRNYASSSWCLNELLEIVRCKEEFGQMVVPIFYHLDPSHVRNQTGDFGKMFEQTCQHKTEDQKIRWRRALTDVANILGYHSVAWDNEASMVEEFANDVLGKLTLSPSNVFEDFVRIEDHIKEISSLLHLESEEVRMVGIWGPSGIGKTTIARALFSRLSCQFRSSVFIEKVFISKSMDVYSRASLVDYNMKLHLQRTFLAEILDKKDIKIDHIGAIEKILKNHKVLIFVDDLDDQDVLDALVGQIFKTTIWTIKDLLADFSMFVMQMKKNFEMEKHDESNAVSFSYEILVTSSLFLSALFI